MRGFSITALTPIGVDALTKGIEDISVEEKINQELLFKKKHFFLKKNHKNKT